MERLTYKDEFGRWTADLHYGGVVEHLRDVPIDRLAAYEDTGMEPEDADQIRKAAEYMMFETVGDFVRFAISNFEELQAYHTFGPVQELSALVKARDEGRMHIDPPPAKEGDPKPGCFYEDGGSLWCLGLSHKGDDEPIDRCKQCWYCESGDYADDRTEAEAALQKGGTHETDPV